MTPLNLLALVGLSVCWLTFGLTWLGGAIYYQSHAPAERSRATSASPAMVGIVIIIAVQLAVPRADWRSLTVHAPWFRFLGLAILLAATAFTFWARVTLGAMWSAAPTVKEHHQLRTDGPYRITRHPI